MSNTEPFQKTIDDEALLVSQLALERCKNDLAHLHALIYFGVPNDTQHAGIIRDSVLKVMADMERELDHSTTALSR